MKKEEKETIHINNTEAYRKFKKLYNKAASMEVETFWFDGAEYNTVYAKYLIEHLTIKKIK